MLKGDEGCDDYYEDFTDRTVDGRGGGGRWIRVHRKMRCSVVEGRVNISPWFNHQMRKSVCSIAISK
jgi:hypothetical protein